MTNDARPALRFAERPPLSNPVLNALFAAGWPEHHETDFAAQLARSLTWIGAFDVDRLVGYVNVVGDGGAHAFILDTTVDPEYRRRGIGTRLVTSAADAARRTGAHWLHVDFEPRLAGFYRDCGFRPTQAGLLRLD